MLARDSTQSAPGKRKLQRTQVWTRESPPTQRGSLASLILSAGITKDPELII